MISVVYCTRQSNPSHQEHIIKTSGLHNNIEVIEIINNGSESLTKCYNRGLKQAKYNIVVFTHDDITIETKQWGHKLLKLYERNSEYGILGVAGTKYLSETGQWWQDRKKMYGRVAHTHEGKTWLSKYSDDINNDIEEVIIVDGVFFSVHKNRIKKDFDETVEGFHFYDVTFGIDNYLEGVKIGVHTNIRINHKSIGITNEQWENNRVSFANKYKDKLPIKIKKIFRPNEKVKVLIGCLNFNGYTGSELYTYELAKELINQGCDVSVCSQIGEPLLKKAHSYGIKLYSIQEPPGFKLGDGEWVLKTPNGDVKSEKNKLYKISDIQFDILHLNHKPITEHLLKLYPNTDAICSIHSEVIELEHPVIHSNIKRYIAIRPEIKEYLANKFNIDKNIIDVIYNPIDYTRFKKLNNKINNEKPIVLFVGTIDYLRKNAIEDLINITRVENKMLWIVGKKNDNNYLDNMIKDESHVKYFEPTHRIEELVQKSDIVAGILLGRTTIEGWMCGKDAIIYDVDNVGNIKSKSFHNPPNDIDKFRSDTVAKNIIEKYKEIIC